MCTLSTEESQTLDVQFARSGLACISAGRGNRVQVFEVPGLEPARCAASEPVPLASILREPRPSGDVTHQQEAHQLTAPLNAVVTLEGGSYVAGDDQGTLHVFTSAHQVRSRVALGRHPVRALAASRTLVVALCGPEVVLVDARTFTKTGKLETQETITSLAIDPEGKTLSAGTISGSLLTYDLASRTLQGRLDLPKAGSITSVNLTPGGLIVMGSTGETENVHLIEPGAERSGFLASEYGVRVAHALDSMSPIATASIDGTVAAYDRTGKRLWHNDAHRKPLTALVQSPSGVWTASAGCDGTIRLWTTASGKERLQYENVGMVRALAFTRDGKALISGGEDGRVRVLRAPSSVQAIVRSAPQPLEDILSLGTNVVAAGKRDGVLVFSAESESPIAVLEDSRYPIAASRSGHRLATAGADDTILIFDEELEELEEWDPEFRFYEMAMNAEGTRLALANVGTLKVLDVETGTVQGSVARLGRMEDLVWLTGDIVATADQERRVTLIDVRRFEKLTTLEGFQGPVNVLATDGSGKFACGDERGIVTLCEWTGKQARKLREFRHEASVHALTFTNEGTHLVASGNSKARTLRIYDITSGEAVEEYPGHERANVRGLCRAPHGFASASLDRTLAFWKFGGMAR